MRLGVTKCVIMNIYRKKCCKDFLLVNILSQCFNPLKGPRSHGPHAYKIKLEGDKFGRKSTSHCCWFCWLGGLTLHCKFSLSIIQGKINESSDKLRTESLVKALTTHNLRPFEDNNYHTNLHSPLSEQQLSHTLALTTYHECPFSKTTTSHILAARWERHWLVNWSKDITMGFP